MLALTMALRSVQWLMVGAPSRLSCGPSIWICTASAAGAKRETRTRTETRERRSFNADLLRIRGIYADHGRARVMQFTSHQLRLELGPPAVQPVDFGLRRVQFRVTRLQRR